MKDLLRLISSAARGISMLVMGIAIIFGDTEYAILFGVLYLILKQNQVR